MWSSQEYLSWPLPVTTLIYRWWWNERNLLLHSEKFLWCNNWSSHHRKLGPCIIVHENNLRILSVLSYLQWRNISYCYTEGPNWIFDGTAVILKECNVSAHHLTRVKGGERSNSSEFALFLQIGTSATESNSGPSTPVPVSNIYTRNSGETKEIAGSE